MSKPIFIFDVDGVINNIHTYQVDLRVIDQMITLLNNDYFVTINTGRGYDWIQTNIIHRIMNHVTSPSLSNVFVAAEMGGLKVKFENGTEIIEETAFSLTDEQIATVKNIFNTHYSNKNINWYQGKLSMATIEKPSGVKSEDFLKIANIIGDQIRDIFKESHIKVVVNPDAIDVTTNEAGKWAGAQLIHDWILTTPEANNKKYICLGDNSSDYEMARYFGRQNHIVKFVYTGKNIGAIEHDQNVEFINTEFDYCEATYQFLKQFLEQC